MQQRIEGDRVVGVLQDVIFMEGVLLFVSVGMQVLLGVLVSGIREVLGVDKEVLSDDCSTMRLLMILVLLHKEISLINKGRMNVPLRKIGCIPVFIRLFVIGL